MLMNSYIKSLQTIKPQLVISIGKAGTGKTRTACIEGINHIETNNFNKLVITRPTVPLDNESIGYIPGKIEDKMEPWLIPMLSHIEDYVGKHELKSLLKHNKIEVCPFLYMRGRTFKNSYIIADEMQNSTKEQFKTILTRLSNDSKLIITGDLEQTDLVDNGLLFFITKLQQYSDYLENIEDQHEHQKLTEKINTLINLIVLEDVKRSDFVDSILSIYNLKY